MYYDSDEADIGREREIDEENMRDADAEFFNDASSESSPERNTQLSQWTMIRRQEARQERHEARAERRRLHLFQHGTNVDTEGSSANQQPPNPAAPSSVSPSPGVQSTVPDQPSTVIPSAEPTQPSTGNLPADLAQPPSSSSTINIASETNNGLSHLIAGTDPTTVTPQDPGQDPLSTNISTSGDPQPMSPNIDIGLGPPPKPERGTSH